MEINAKRSRSIVKTITYRLLIVITDAIIIYVITKRLDVTVVITGFTNIIRSILYYFHERAWNKISWGRI